MNVGTSDIEEIRQVLYRYCRGLDRMDEAMVLDCFAVGATVDYKSIFTGSAVDFVTEVWVRHAVHMRHSHQIGNVLVEADGDGLISEAYATVTLWTETDGGPVERIVRGRYVDRWTRTENGWRIARRVYVADHRSDRPLPPDAVTATVSHSRRDHDDPSYEIFPATAGAPYLRRDEDRRAIEELKARYLNALDCNDWEAMEACLTPDIEVSFAGGRHRYSGREAVMDFYANSTLAQPENRSNHVTTNPLIDIDGPNSARGVWRLTDHVHRPGAGSLLVGSGIYEDTYRRTPDGWKIAKSTYDRLVELRIDV